MNVPLQTPETNPSLLVKIRNPADQRAWAEFVQLYGPVIHRAVRAIGLQDADASDVTQQVLFAVATTLEKRPHDPDRARFRTWLSRVTRHTALNAMRRLRNSRKLHIQHPVAIDDAAGPRDDSHLLDQEYEREIFHVAARNIEAEFESKTWQAFWLTAVEGNPIDSTASRLGVLPGTVYAARSRIMRRLRIEVDRLTDAPDR